jgi:hypothetical protein
MNPQANPPPLLSSPPPLPLDPEKVLPEKNLPNHFRRNFIIIMFLTIGPLALPFVWLHPTMRLHTKLIIITITLLASYALYLLTRHLLRILMEQLETLESLMGVVTSNTF